MSAALYPKPSNKINSRGPRGSIENEPNLQSVTTEKHLVRAASMSEPTARCQTHTQICCYSLTVRKAVMIQSLHGGQATMQSTVAVVCIFLRDESSAESCTSSDSMLSPMLKSCLAARIKLLGRRKIRSSISRSEKYIGLTCADLIAVWIMPSNSSRHGATSFPSILAQQGIPKAHHLA